MTDTFTTSDLLELGALVADAWSAAADRDWSVPAGTLEWDCLRTADHAVDTVMAPAFFLASRRQDRYPDMGRDFVVGPGVTVGQLVERLAVATWILASVVDATDPGVRAVIRRRPEVQTGPPQDFAPRGGMELILHAHDICKGLGVPFEPSPEVCAHLIEHTADWPWSLPGWSRPTLTGDPWGDLLNASGRAR